MEFSTIALLIVLLIGSIYIGNLRVNLTISRTHVDSLTKQVDLKARKITAQLEEVNGWVKRYQEIVTASYANFRLQVNHTLVNDEMDLSDALGITKERRKELENIIESYVFVNYPCFSTVNLFQECTYHAKSLEEFTVLVCLTLRMDEHLHRRDMMLLAEIAEYQITNGIENRRIWIESEKLEEAPVEEYNGCVDCMRYPECDSPLKN